MVEKRGSVRVAVMLPDSILCDVLSGGYAIRVRTLARKPRPTTKVVFPAPRAYVPRTDKEWWAVALCREHGMLGPIPVLQDERYHL